ncbi:hypothetical protein AVEN_126089-1 [Araneus ventricosus]|uniref:Uncharacterized protein n=1 Tax=Araneus ventricosus TaxID=182803 RepID=A0A4Y2CLY2_ARAVE|nr:hypothetical protein AVEN_126089-1 [Araneus ventricosus]
MHNNRLLTFTVTYIQDDKYSKLFCIAPASLAASVSKDGSIGQIDTTVFTRRVQIIRPVIRNGQVVFVLLLPSAGGSSERTSGGQAPESLALE